MKFARIVGILFGLYILQILMMPTVWAGIVSTKQEIAIGESVANQIEKQYKLVEDPALQERVAEIGSRIVAVSGREGMKYTFKVLDVDEVNAMAAPGGFIYVFKGLTDLMQTDDEIAGILAHEVGHVVKRHSMGQLEKSLGMTLLMAAAFGGKGFALQAVALSAISAGYSREDERAADRMGYELSAAAGYNPYGMLIGLRKLQDLHPEQQSDLFSDHPEAAARIKLMERYLKEDHVTVTAQEAEGGKSAMVTDGSWALPMFKVAEGGAEPLCRAYLTAGNLSRIAALADYSADRYILDGDGINVAIYYDDQKIVTLTPEDALAEDKTLDQIVDRYLEALKRWRVAQAAA